MVLFVFSNALQKYFPDHLLRLRHMCVFYLAVCTNGVLIHTNITVA